MPSEYDLVIIGSGIVGLTAACRLSQQYANILVLERLPAPEDWSLPVQYGLRVSALNLASVKLLSDIGVWDAITALRVQPYHSMCVWDPSQGGEIRFHASETIHEQLGYIVENDVLQQALLAQLKTSSRVSIQYSTQPVKLTALRDRVLMETSQGDQLLAKLILAADGKNSVTRGLANIRADFDDYHQLGLVAVCHTQRSHQNTAWQCFTALGPLAMLPLAPQLCSMVWSLPQEQAEKYQQLPQELFEHELSKPMFSHLGAITLESKLASFPLQGMQAHQYVNQRVVLMGDAAHQVHPLAGQGLNLGLADVDFLAQILADTDRELGSERILRKYERARKTENLLMQKSFEWIDQLFHSQSRLLGLGRCLGLRIVDKSPPLKSLFMEKAIGLSI